MKLIFGENFDGPVWPNPLQDKEAVIGEATVGEHGLLKHLETLVGTTGPEANFFDRSLAYLEALQKTDNPKRFFHHSLQIDPIGVCKHLLMMRDDLIMHGWDGTKHSNLKKLKDLADVELNFSSLPGIPERLRKVHKKLNRTTKQIAELKIFDSIDSFTPLWQDILQCLEKGGTKVTYVPSLTEGQAKKSDLGTLQGILKNGSSKAPLPKGDDSFRLLTLQDPWQAARWLAALLEQKALSGIQQPFKDIVVIVPPRYSEILAQACKERNIPLNISSGQSQFARPALQILILALGLAWHPKDPMLALELLLLPLSPIPKRTAKTLAKALGEAPAVSGIAWKKAMESHLKYLTDNSKIPDEVEKLQARIQKFIEHDGPPLGQGLEADQLAQICNSVSEWARGIGGMKGLNSCLDVATVADSLAKACSRIFNRPIHADELLRLLADLANTGVSSSGPQPLNSGLILVSDPSCIIGTVRDVIWWDFSTGATDRMTKNLWTETEKPLLHDAGIRVRELAAIGTARLQRWTRPLINCCGSFLGINFNINAEGGGESHHPILDYALPSDPQIRSKWIAKTATGHLKEVYQEKKENLEHEWPMPPSSDGKWTFENSKFTAPDHVSPSSMQQLLGCLFAHALDKGLGITSAASLELPEYPLLHGRIAHEVLQRVFPKGTAPTPDDAATQAKQVFEEYVPKLAAQLLLPTRRGDYADIINTIVNGARSYAVFLQENGFDVIDAEGKLPENNFPGLKPKIPLKGRVDQLLGTKTTPQLVIDFKWSGIKSREHELREGSAIQLACYTHMAKTPTSNPSVGYFFLESGHPLILNAPDTMKGTQSIKGISPEEILDHAAEDIATNLDILKSGTVTASGLDDLAQKSARWKAPCTYCQYSTLCGQRWKIKKNQWARK